METGFNFLNVVVHEALSIAIPFMVFTLFGFIVQTFRQLKNEFIARHGERRWWQLSGIVQANVRAAEQLGLKDELLQSGQAKKLWVLKQVELAAERIGIEIDANELSNMIETAVWDEFNRLKNNDTETSPLQ